MISHNPGIDELYRHATELYRTTSTGAIVAYSGKYTGRCPDDKRISCGDITHDDVWWGTVNKELSQTSHELYYNYGLKHIFGVGHKHIYIIDSYAGWDDRDGGERINVRTICSDPYHALFMRNMLILADCRHAASDIDLTILNCGDIAVPGTCVEETHRSGITENLVGMDLDQGRAVIYGTNYAGEMKKLVLTYIMHIMPRNHHLPLHSSACLTPRGETIMFFGLSGTGKTTLSATEGLQLIGDDEHVWTDRGIFNVEGGCYAKCINLTQRREPEIFNAIRHGAVIENVIVDDDGLPDYSDTSITQNTRCSYPLSHLDNVKIPAYSDTHPKNIIFLVCDAFGIFPAISKLTIDQARFYFMLGYTCKMTGTEQGISQPTKTFSSCFAEPFITRHPRVYGDLLKNKIIQHDTNVWLLNTGWLKTGERMDLAVTRSIVKMVSDGTDMGRFTKHQQLDLMIPISLPGVDEKYLYPELNWDNVDEYHRATTDISEEFLTEFNSKFDEK
jgi:phosphoenolpyruvate carboxykinase (ATP)